MLSSFKLKSCTSLFDRCECGFIAGGSSGQGPNGHERKGSMVEGEQDKSLRRGG